MTERHDEKWELAGWTRTKLRKPSFYWQCQFDLNISRYEREWPRPDAAKLSLEYSFLHVHVCVCVCMCACVAINLLIRCKFVAFQNRFMCSLQRFMRSCDEFIKNREDIPVQEKYVAGGLEELPSACSSGLRWKCKINLTLCLHHQ